GVVVVQQLYRLGWIPRLDDARERADVAEHRRRVHLVASEREAGSQQILGHFLRRELADQLALLIAKTLLLEARTNARIQQHRVDRLVEGILGSPLDAPDHPVRLVE